MLFYLLAQRSQCYTTGFSQIIAALSFRGNPVEPLWADEVRVVLVWPFHQWLRDSRKKTGLSDGRSCHIVNLLVVENDSQVAERKVQSKEKPWLLRVSLISAVVLCNRDQACPPRSGRTRQNAFLI